MYSQYLLICLLTVAVLMDFKYDRIYNHWILLGSLLGLFLRICGHGGRGVYSAAASMLLSFCLLYPIYVIGGLGAGDVKLFIMTGSFISVGRFLHIAVISFGIGAIFSIGKMISEKNFKERMQCLLSYLLDIFCTGKWKLYGENIQPHLPKYKKNKIHFALPIYISVVLELGGLF